MKQLKNKIIKPVGPLRGSYNPPGDKSISHRAALFSSLTQTAQKIEFKNFASGQDCQSTLTCLRKMGIESSKQNDQQAVVQVTTPGFKNLKEPATVLDCGNSGTTMRLLSGILAGCPFYSVLTGDHSLNNRPMGRIINPLLTMGATIWARNNNSLAPISINGGNLSAIKYHSKVASAQVKSAILLAGLNAKGETWVSEDILSRDHTERMLTYFGIEVMKKNPQNDKVNTWQVGIEGGALLEAKSMFIPGDISSAAFFIAAALIIEGSDLLIKNVGLNPTRTGFLKALAMMGIELEITITEDEVEPIGDIRVRSQPLKPFVIQGELIPSLIDEIPILAVLAACAEGESVIKDAAELRVKESDRLKTTALNLELMGVNVFEKQDGMIIEGGAKLKGAELNAFHDHRIALAFAVAALAAEGESLLIGADSVAVSLPNFFETIANLEQSGVF